MTLRQYLILMSGGTLIGWLSWLFIVLRWNPSEAGWFGLIFFYASLALASLGTYSVGGFFVLRLFKDSTVAFRQVKQTFRQGLLAAIAVDCLLWLAAARLLHWWNLALLVGLILIVELGLFTSRSDRADNNYAE